jgi:hypothetical protein
MSMEYTADYCDYVLHCGMPKFKMAENQTGSRYILLCIKDTNIIRKRTSNEHRKNNLLYIVMTDEAVTGKHYFAVCFKG